MNQNFNKEKIDFIVSCINSKMSIFYDVLNEARESIISDIKKLNHVLSEMCETMGEDKLEAFKRRLKKSSRYIITSGQPTMRTGLSMNLSLTKT